MNARADDDDDDDDDARLARDDDENDDGLSFFFPSARTTHVLLDALTSWRRSLHYYSLLI